MPSSKVAIFAVDPGTTSGVACGVFPDKASSVWDGLTEGKWQSYEVNGVPAEQAWEIVGNFAEWTDWPKHRRLDAAKHILVLEDFVLRLGPGAGSKRVLLDPVRVVSACDALCLQRNGLRWAFPIYQTSSLAKTFATDERLRRHGMWVTGSTHRRDAVRHMARMYASLLGKDK